MIYAGSCFCSALDCVMMRQVLFYSNGAKVVVKGPGQAPR